MGIYSDSNRNFYSVDYGVLTITKGTLGGTGVMQDYTSSANVTSIVTEPFTSVIVGKGITVIGAYSFYNLNVSSVVVGDDVIEIKDYAFSVCRATQITLGNSITTIGEFSFSGCSLTSVNLPDSLTTLGNQCFQQSKLESITIPATVTSIGILAFALCTQLTSAEINCSTVADRMFYGCSALASVTMNNVTSIESTAFRGASITEVTIPATVTFIDVGAFYYCDSLSSAIVEGATPARITFMSFNSTMTIYVPASAVSTYKESWSSYADQIQAIPSPPSARKYDIVMAIIMGIPTGI